jgi:putative NADH-flavin reductase
MRGLRLNPSTRESGDEQGVDAAGSRTDKTGAMKLLLLYLAYSLGLTAALWRRGVNASPASARKPALLRQVRRVLVIGATGGTGRALVQQALDRDYVVTAFVRNPAHLRIEHAGLSVARGDVQDYDSVAAAVRGQDAVLSALGHRRFFGPTRVLSVGTRNLLQAMEAHGVERLVCETSLGIGSSAGRMGVYYTLFVIPVILPFYFWDKTRQERLISASRTSWTVVRPGALTNGPSRRGCRHGQSVGSLLWTRRIPRSDVASFMLDELAQDRYVHAAVGVTS